MTAQTATPIIGVASTPSGLCLGFSAWNEAEIDTGVDIIGKVLREMGVLRP